MPQINGTRIRTIIEQAQSDSELRIRLFHCPDKVIADSDLTVDEARAVRMGDLSAVDLDEPTLELGRRLFTELPKIEGQTAAAAQYLLFSSEHIQALCT